MERDREQADLPTEQPPSGEDPRIPASDADSRRPRHPAGPSAQGPLRTVGLSRPSFVLPAAHRLRSSADFSAVTRRGQRARRGSLVGYLLQDGQGPPVTAGLGAVSDQTSSVSQVGLIVGRAVGGSVIRHRVSRRLRAQLADRLDRLPADAQLVVRALPPASTASSIELAADLDVLLARLSSARSEPAGSGRR
jgi:ribonuclease P protein component